MSTMVITVPVFSYRDTSSGGLQRPVRALPFFIGHGVWLERYPSRPHTACLLDQPAALLPYQTMPPGLPVGYRLDINLKPAGLLIWIVRLVYWLRHNAL
jgi:hypothetical protein